MRRLNKKLLAMIMSIFFVCSLPMVAGAVSGTFTTYGGPYCKTWDYVFRVNEVGTVYYRLYGNITQPDIYKYNNAEMYITLYCNGEKNVVSNVKKTDTYFIETCADAFKTKTNGKGSMYVYVEDNLYGKYQYTYYN